MDFELTADAAELLEGFRHQLFHRRFFRAGGNPALLGDALRRADAGNDILALRIDEEFAVERLFAGRGIAGEGDAGRRCIAEIAEDHRLDVDGRTPAFRNIVELTVGDGARALPAGKDGADRAPELNLRILRKLLLQLLLYQALVERDDMLPFRGADLGIEFMAEPRFLVFEDFLEGVVAEAHDDIGIHLDEAAIAVPGKTRVAGIVAERLHGLVVEAEIEHCVHHARHRDAGAGAHGEQQRLAGGAEMAAGDRLDRRYAGANFGLQPVLDMAAIFVIGVAGVADDRQPRWNGKT